MLRKLVFAALQFAALCHASPFQESLVERQNGGRLVFAHFMMGIVPNRRSASDYDADMLAAKAAGIDAFALNIGTDTYNQEQLNYAYESAANNNMKAFISFDFHYWKTSDTAAIGYLIKTYGSKPGQLKVDNKVFVSSFLGDGINVAQVRQAAGMDIYFAPNWVPTGDRNAVDGALNWAAWDNDCAGRAPKPGRNCTVESGDAAYTNWLAGKGYIAPVSPWFFTHFGNEVSYPKNFMFPGDLLWFDRWNQMLQLSPRFIEILTWNDYGESHYVGPLSSKHTDDGNSKWVNDMPHTGFLDMAKPYIAAYKAGQTSAASYVTQDKLVYWYKPTLKTLNCDSTDTVGARPDGYDTLEDAVFVVAMLKQAGRVTATSGSNSRGFDAPAGISAWKVPMGVGKQTFKLERSGQQVLSVTSLRDVSNTCPCGLYNYNAYVGTVPAGPNDALQPEGLTNFKNGLKVACDARPSITSTPPAASSTPTPPPTSRTSSTTSTRSSSPSATSKTSSTPPVVTTTPTPTTTGRAGCTITITESKQIFPTNCLKSGEIWGGSPNGAPDCCDGARPCCRL
ncbi:glycoside hydrolase family 71 protein [Sporormia fimetaria CBS 119925]|uniref:Glycoside hydrolase family 71 protein n=1 Tax=Sporormia fimetaria CBS 119925 TaxID=1340428 RepID=A0A6A6UUZ7_9PLEO|nr:glycoside hydrolase family 71 protein [Sporormia fimetaria CBS 119925]